MKCMKRCRRLAREDDVEDVGRAFLRRRETRERETRGRRKRWCARGGRSRKEARETRTTEVEDGGDPRTDVARRRGEVGVEEDEDEDSGELGKEREREGVTIGDDEVGDGDAGAGDEDVEEERRRGRRDERTRRARDEDEDEDDARRAARTARGGAWDVDGGMGVKRWRGIDGVDDDDDG